MSWGYHSGIKDAHDNSGGIRENGRKQRILVQILGVSL